MSADRILAAPDQPTAEEGRRWAEEELSKPRYSDADVSPLERLGRAIQRFFDRLFDSASTIESPLVPVLLVLALLAAAAFVIWRMRRGAGSTLEALSSRRAVFRSELDPQELRSAAERAAAAGDWRTAVQERIRAAFAELIAADLVDVAKATTAAELAAAGAAAVPQAAEACSGAGRLFDRVSFSGAEAVEADCRAAERLDAAITAAVASTRARTAEART